MELVLTCHEYVYDPEPPVAVAVQRLLVAPPLRAVPELEPDTDVGLKLAVNPCDAADAWMYFDIGPWTF